MFGAKTVTGSTEYMVYSPPTIGYFLKPWILFKIYGRFKAIFIVCDYRIKNV